MYISQNPAGIPAATPDGDQDQNSNQDTNPEKEKGKEHDKEQKTSYICAWTPNMFLFSSNDVSPSCARMAAIVLLKVVIAIGVCQSALSAAYIRMR